MFIILDILQKSHSGMLIGHLEEVEGDKYLIISSENGDTMQKYQEVFDGIKEIINKMGCEI